MFELLVSLLITVLAVTLVRRLLGIERGRWVVTVLAVLVGEVFAVLVLRTGMGTSGSPASSRVRRVRLGHGVRDARHRRGEADRQARRPLAAARHPPPDPRNATPCRAGGSLREGKRHRGAARPHRSSGQRCGRARLSSRQRPERVVRGRGRPVREARSGHGRAAPSGHPGQWPAARPASGSSRASRPRRGSRRHRKELGPPDEIFTDLSSELLGSASIAQTYAARLRDGREVVVKVQRPGVRESIEQDLDILARLSNRLERRTTSGAIARSEGAGRGVRLERTERSSTSTSRPREQPRSGARSQELIGSTCRRSSPMSSPPVASWCRSGSLDRASERPAPSNGS